MSDTTNQNDQNDLNDESRPDPLPQNNTVNNISFSQAAQNTLVDFMTKALVESVKKAQPEIGGLFSKGLVGATASVGEQVGKSAEKAVSGLKLVVEDGKINLKASIEANVAALGKQIQDGLGDYGQIMLHFGVDLEQDVMPAITKILDTPLLSKENLVRFSAVVGAQGLVDAGKQLLKPYADVEKKIKDIERAGLKATAGFSNAISTDLPEAEGTGASFRSAAEGVQEYKNAITSMVNRTRMSIEASEKVIQDFADQGLSTRALRDFGLGAIDARDGIDGFTEAMKLSLATGLSTAEIAENLNFQTRSLGTTTEKATDIYGDFAEISRKYNVRIQDIAKGTFAAAQKLKYFGDTTKGVTNLYNQFLGSLGKGKETIARELVDQLADNLGKMDASLRAFIGTTSGIGGGRGAIGGALEVEEAISRGDLSTVMKGVTDQIEKISGSRILSRREALDTGQEQQFFLQRQLIKSQLGVGEQEATQVMEALSKGLSVPIEALKGEAGKARLEETGAQKLAIQTGALEGAFNVADMNTAISMTGGIAKDMNATALQMQNGAESFEKGSRILQQIFGKSMQEQVAAMETTGLSFVESMKQQGEEQRTGKAPAITGTKEEFDARAAAAPKGVVGALKDRATHRDAVRGAKAQRDAKKDDELKHGETLDATKDSLNAVTLLNKATAAQQADEKKLDDQIKDGIAKDKAALTPATTEPPNTQTPEVQSGNMPVDVMQTMQLMSTMTPMLNSMLAVQQVGFENIVKALNALAERDAQINVNAQLSIDGQPVRTIVNEQNHQMQQNANGGR